MILLKSFKRKEVNIKTIITIRIDLGVNEMDSPIVNLELKKSIILLIKFMWAKVTIKTKPTLVKGWEKIAMKKKITPTLTC
jgi:hypothetical protein